MSNQESEDSSNAVVHCLANLTTKRTGLSGFAPQSILCLLLASGAKERNIRLGNVCTNLRPQRNQAKPAQAGPFANALQHAETISRINMHTQ